VFFDEPTVEALCDAISVFQRHATAFSPAAMRGNALRFNRPVFRDKIKDFVAGKMGITIG
jgi:hypothetical protein